MRLAVLKERRPGEARVAATPETVKKLIGLGLTVAVEAGAGQGASIPDADYAAAGAEIDLVLELPGKRRVWAIEIKRGLTGSPGKGFHNAREDLKPERSFVVYSGDERYPITKGVEALGLRELASLLEKT